MSSQLKEDNRNKSKSLFENYAVGKKERRKHNGESDRTKEGVFLKVNKPLTDFIEVEGNKQRINITLNPFLWNELGHITDNKSAYVNDLLKKIIEKELGKKIRFIPKG